MVQELQFNSIRGRSGLYAISVDEAALNIGTIDETSGALQPLVTVSRNTPEEGLEKVLLKSVPVFSDLSPESQQDVLQVVKTFLRTQSPSAELLEDIDRVTKMLNDKAADVHVNQGSDAEFKRFKREAQIELHRLRQRVAHRDREYGDFVTRYKSTTDRLNECAKKVLRDKQEIIKNIQLYNEKWKAWADTCEMDATAAKKKAAQLQDDLDSLRASMQKVQQENTLSRAENEKLHAVMSSIETELNKTIDSQVELLNSKDTEIERQSAYIQRLEIERQIPQNTANNGEIDALKAELERVKALLDKNNETKIAPAPVIHEYDYDTCFATLKNFVNLNNVFARKAEVIAKLDAIMASNSQMAEFINLDEKVKTKLRAEFDGVKHDILDAIERMGLAKYVGDQNLQLLRSKKTQKQVPEAFCDELIALLKEWSENVARFRDQDRKLTNIYEDLSGAVRVYVRIKPLQGNEKSTVSIGTLNSKKQRNVLIDCGGAQGAKTYGDFYGVFEDTFSNLDVYTGVQNSKTVFGVQGLAIDTDKLVEETDSVSPGLHSAFKQIEDGYSIVIFGYGLSGSGKSFTLLGSYKDKDPAKNTPGILHYGLANLQGVANIRLKNLFEQYKGVVSVNLGQVTGRVINLVGTVPGLRMSVSDGTFKTQAANAGLNLDSLKVDDLYTLTRVLDGYRETLRRIKKTPNNDQSSRSHLYMVFEVTMDTGKKGYVTVCDTAGRENPVDIYKTFIDPAKMTFTTALTQSSGSGLEGAIVPQYKGVYSADDVLDILKEGVYINETINHLMYFFNQKNYRIIEPKLQKSGLQYKVDGVFVLPKNEMNVTDISEKNNALMIPVLKYLDNLGDKKRSDDDFRPTKFIMMCMVRQEEKYCNQSLETLDFAQKVKSS